MIKYFDKFVFRAPLLPIEVFQAIENFETVDDYLRTVLQRAEIQEAIYIASAHFHEEVHRFLAGDYNGQDAIKKLVRFRASALKYLNRMASRSTPFGLFAGCGIGDIKEAASHIEINGQQNYRRRARLDASYLIEFTTAFARDPLIQRQLLYYPNNTIYEIGDKCRYVEFSDANGVRHYNLSAFSNSPYIDQLLVAAKYGKSLVDLALSLVDEEISLADAEAFTLELVEAKILISELEPKVVGDDYQTQLFQVFERILGQPAANESEMEVQQTIKRYQYYLTQITQQFESIGVENNVPHFQAVEQMISASQSPSTKYFLQVDSELVTEKAVLSSNLVQQVREGIKCFARFCSVYPNKELLQFQNKFSERYEDQMVPLVEALDPEYGIGFANLGVEQFGYSALVDDIPVPPGRPKGATSIPWDFNHHSFLFQKILHATKNNQGVIHLTDKDVEHFSYHPELFPPTFNAVVSVIPQEDKDHPLIYFHESGKDSATAMIGRFGYFNPEFDQLVKDLSTFEADTFKDRIVAEINHLADSRSVNITQRSKNHAYEIGYVTKSNSTEEGLIDIRDIYVGIVRNSIVLYSKELDKEIVPRLSNAHNYRFNSLPLYKFLAAMQEEQPNGFYEFVMNLGSIPSLVQYIPRFQYKNYVLRTASWVVDAHELKKFKIFPFDQYAEKVRQYFQEHQLPSVFFLNQNDSPLYLDINNRGALLVLADVLTKSNFIQLQECIYEQGKDFLIKNEQGGYFHELMVPFRNAYLRNKNDQTPRFEIPPIASPALKRKIVPSHDWLYFKLYAGINICDKIVKEQLPDLVALLQEQDLIESFFYIRYADPAFHLRLRFKLNGRKSIDRIIQCFNDFFEADIASKNIWRISIDTYQRELERYGMALIDAAESIFNIDSHSCMQLLQLLEGNVEYEKNWLLSLKIMDTYLDVFELSAETKRAFLSERKLTFSQLFHANKMQKRKLAVKYKNHQEQVDRLLCNNQAGFVHWPQMDQLLRDFKCDLTKVYQAHFQSVPFEQKMDLLRSFIHMSVLRFVRSKNKLHEYVLFFLLERHYSRPQELLDQIKQDVAKTPLNEELVL